MTTESTRLSEKLAKLASIKAQSLSDLYYFNKYVLGYNQMEEQPHRELCNFMAATSCSKMKKLILMPRGTFKSSVITMGYSLWKLVNNPDLRILISSETYNQSKMFLKGIKAHIEQNDMFQAAFGDLKGKESVWRADEITIAAKTSTTTKEPSVAVSGVGQTKVGQHYDLIILDDVVSNNNINTQEQITKIINHYKLLLSILDPGGMIIVIGTRYSFADLYGHILEYEKDSFDILERSAIRDDGSLYFPTRLTREFLDAQRKAQGSQIFSNQYQNKCVDDESAMFKERWLKFYKTPPAGLRHFMTIDPAASQEKAADFNGIVVGGIDADNNIYVLEAINQKGTIIDTMNIVFDLVQQYNINNEGSVGLEVQSMQQTLKFIFTEEMNKRKIWFNIVELKPHNNRNKYNRVKSLQPFFENGKIYYSRKHYELIDQTLKFPRCKHDDIIDSLAYLLEIMAPGDVANIVEEATHLTVNEKAVFKDIDDIRQKRFVRQTRVRI